MTITFYTTTSDPKCLTKDISGYIGTGHALAPTEQVGCLNPVIVIDYNSLLLPANYCYIDTFGRYYWCNVAVTTAQRMIVSCQVDYLMSWAEYIATCQCTVIRSEQAGVNYVIDNQLPIDPTRYNTQGVTFPDTSITYNNGLITPQYIMITR